MAGATFFVFVLPALLGAIAAVLLCFFPKLRRFASYVFLVPLLGGYGASVGLDAGLSWVAPYLREYASGLSPDKAPVYIRIIAAFIAGGVLGVLAGAFAGYGVNRVARTPFAHRRRLATAVLLIGAAMISAVGLVQFRHRAEFGHFVPLALHADYSVAYYDIGIPGITKLYEAHITNFGILPLRIERCEFVTDAFAPGVSVGYRLQKWDASSRHWQTILDAASEYCRPYPLAMVEARLTSKWLWPGQTLSTGDEATAARGNLKGETLRFLVVANGRELPTAAFTIDEQVQGADVNYRVRH
jgi:hypothetical protein